jgi:glutamyl-tRNA synthetase
MENKPTIRTRFAPSPTGFMHVGNLRTALFAWLTARNSGGEFILRIEDTDQKREVSGALEHLMLALKSLGINYDEGPDIDGPHAPYVQSQRLDVYKKWAERLIAEGRAYADPYTPEEIEDFRKIAVAEKRAFLYRNHRPENPKPWDGSTALRFKSDPKDYRWKDEVMGELSATKDVVDDFILIKSDGYPTYNFAHIVDDAEMRVTHVIRGQEFISSTPNYLNLYEALNLNTPIFASMPHILAESGNKKLGKRDGAKDILEYLKEGYLKETMINFIASMGWNDGTEQEIFNVDELVEKFKLSRVQQSGARFDDKRLLWMNGQWIRSLDVETLLERAESFWPDSVASSDSTKKKEVLAVVQDRLKTLTELPVMTSYFFETPKVDWSMIDENKFLSTLTKFEMKNLLESASDELSKIEFTDENLEKTLNHLLEISGQKPAVLFSLIRIVVSWAPFSPALNQTLRVIGKDESLKRIEQAIQAL